MNLSAHPFFLDSNLQPSETPYVLCILRKTTFLHSNFERDSFSFRFPSVFVWSCNIKRANEHLYLSRRLHASQLFLYDLSKDPTEQVDVSARYPEKVAELRRRLVSRIGGVVVGSFCARMTKASLLSSH
jgi:hypothetical protein